MSGTCNPQEKIKYAYFCLLFLNRRHRFRRLRVCRLRVLNCVGVICRKKSIVEELQN
jgi:hypothetical protein